MNTFEKARDFIYRNARPLDFARFRYHFENGSREDVLNALSGYQNADGGFGHALEADCWNPESTPIQTWTATEILREINFTDATHAIIRGILRYLASGQYFDGHFWYNTVKSNNNYPHAPWWHTESVSTCHNDYNPTASLAGFIVRYADRDSYLHRLGREIVTESFARLIANADNNDMHTISCYMQQLYYLKSAGGDCVNLAALEGKLREAVRASITKDTAQWGKGYVCKPSQYISSKRSVFYADNSELADYECEHIISTQLADGSWNIPWSWSDYAEQWAISKNWWKSNVIMLNLLYLKAVMKGVE